MIANKGKRSETENHSKHRERETDRQTDTETHTHTQRQRSKGVTALKEQKTKKTNERCLEQIKQRAINKQSHVESRGVMMHPVVDHVTGSRVGAGGGGGGGRIYKIQSYHLLWLLGYGNCTSA